MQDINFRQQQNLQTSPKVQGYQSYQSQNTIKQNKLGNGLILTSVIVTLAVLGGLFFLFSYVFNSAKITIIPTKKDVQLNETYIIDSADRKDIFITKSIPTSEEVALPKNVKKTVNGRAEGNLTIYNESTTIQKFIKNTRFETSDNKIFRIQDAVTVPAKTGGNPGSVKAYVVAETVGENYNIGPSKFTVPGLKGSPKYKLFSAESSETFTGGSSGNQNSVSDLEIEKGKAQIKDKNIAYLNKKLAEDIPEGFSYSKDSLIMLNGPFVKTKEDDDLATYTQNATGTAIYFNKNLLIQKYLAKTEGENLNTNGNVEVLSTNNANVSLLDASDLSDDSKPLRVVLSGTAPVLFKPNKQNIIDYYVGRPVSEFSEIANKFQFINTARKTVRPIWSTSFPTDPSKITVEFEE
jgi:hypothetical protein